MLYKFKSKAASDLIMLEANARRVLELIGKAPTPQGIILAENVPAAISALQAAIAVDERAPKDDDGEPRSDADQVEPDVSLRQRATPLLDMLRRSQTENCPVTWGI